MLERHLAFVGASDAQAHAGGAAPEMVLIDKTWTLTKNREISYLSDFAE